MKPLKYYNANTVESAVSMLEEHKDGVKVVAGGTDLLGTLKDNLHPLYPETVVSLKKIDNLSYIEEDNESLKVGAMTKLSDIQDDPKIKGKYALLAEAAHTVASPQIRNMATIGGNICQEPRCWYYRYPENKFYCLRKGGKICNALTGNNTYHSIFGAAKVCATPCQSACPNGTNISGYLSKVREGDLDGAAQLLLSVNPLAAITGRVCPHYCEDDCNRGEFDQGVSVRDIERFMGDYILNNAGRFFSAPDKESGKNIAVIGSGPAGLTAAFYLRQFGHKVTVFDRNKEAGGMLTYAIPAYRLPKDVVGRVVDVLKNIGVEFKLGSEVDAKATVEDYKNKFDSVFVASGAWGKNFINIPGEELTLSGLEFLYKISNKQQEKPGKKVVVIGGGNVAVDVAISSLRLGAEEVSMVCLESREEMPAWEHELAQALEEGVKLLPSWGPEMILEKDGKVTGILLKKCLSVFNSAGRFAPVYGEEKLALEADCVILAIGQRAEVELYGQNLELKGSYIAADEETQATSMAGVYAWGDAVTGPATVVSAIAGGRKASSSINSYLGGAEIEKAAETYGEMVEFDGSCLENSAKVKMLQRPVEGRAIYTEDALGLEIEAIKEEANRCFNCGCVAVSPSDVAPALIALDAIIKTTKKTIAAEKFFLACLGKSTVLDQDELVTEIQIPIPVAGSVQVYKKFRLRKSIDFPVASVAANLSVQNGKIADARIVLGAVMPVPKRVNEVEDFLKGKAPSLEVAEVAAALAVKGASPLLENEYKVNIVKALVKRSILAAVR